MNLSGILEDFFDPLEKYSSLGGNVLNYRQLGYLTTELKEPPQAIVAKEKEFKDKFKKNNKIIADKLMDHFEKKNKK